MLLHITHAKAGSTWVEGIMRALFKKRMVERGYKLPVFERGRVYSIFMAREDFAKHPELATSRRFIVLRDLRDTLISRYFSIRNSHKPDPAGKIAAIRSRLLEMNEEDGLMEIMGDAGMEATARIQRSWMGSGEIVLRYEDLIANDVQLFTELFVEKLGLPVKAADVERAVISQRFDTLYGRKPGEEDVMSHGRKGIAGDWKNHFTRRLAEHFHSRYGELLKGADYERDAKWVLALKD